MSESSVNYPQPAQGRGADRVSIHRYYYRAKAAQVLSQGETIHQRSIDILSHVPLSVCSSLQFLSTFSCEIFRSFTEAKIIIPHCKNTLLQVKVLHWKIKSEKCTKKVKNGLFDFYNAIYD